MSVITKKEAPACNGEYATLAEALSANKNAASNGQVCHIESEIKFSLLSSPHFRRVYELEGGKGDICPTLFYNARVEKEDGKACAQEMEQKMGEKFRLASLKSECPDKNSTTFNDSISCRWTLEVQKVSPEEAVVLDVKESMTSFETSVQQFFSALTDIHDSNWQF